VDAKAGFEPACTVLQTATSPLGHLAVDVGPSGTTRTCSLPVRSRALIQLSFGGAGLGGSGAIRTPVPACRAGPSVFETAPIGRSGTLPWVDLADALGFEPRGRFNTDRCLAGSSLGPLAHASVWVDEVVAETTGFEPARRPQQPTICFPNSALDRSGTSPMLIAWCCTPTPALGARQASAPAGRGIG
jgi:hypothetical protein